LPKLDEKEQAEGFEPARNSAAMNPRMRLTPRSEKSCRRNAIRKAAHKGRNEKGVIPCVIPTGRAKLRRPVNA
jgi:hypothetical protein